MHEWKTTKQEPLIDIITWVFEDGTFVPTARITDKGSESIVTDYLGTPTQMFDANGEKTWEAQLDIYGRVRTFVGSSLNRCNWRYQGQYFDEDISLCYNRFRWYDQSVGSYISQDPIGLEGRNATLYSYVPDVNTYIDTNGTHIANATYISSHGISGEVGSFESVKGGLHSEPQILTQMGNQRGGHLEITSMGPKGDGSSVFFGNKGGKPHLAGPLPPCGPQRQNCDMLLFNHSKSQDMMITYKWKDANGKINVRTYHPDGKVTQNGTDISGKYHHH